MTTRFFGRLASFLLLLVAFGCATTSPGPEARDRFPLDPREDLAGPFSPGVTDGTRALFAGDSTRALEAFSAARSEGHGLAAEIGWIEAAVQAKKTKEALSSCSRALSAGDPTLPLLVACGEAQARGGDTLAALQLYQRAAARAANRAGIARRADELRDRARGELAARAADSAARRDWAKAREEIARALVLAPRSASLHAAAGDIEARAGDSSRALQRYREALELEPGNRELAQKTAELALRSRDYAVAIPLLDDLSRTDPAYKSLAEEARLGFRVTNWPHAEREAARAERLTRSGAASLVWWMFPEVREARVGKAVIASDVVGRRDSRALARALALGLLEVDRVTHRANPDAFVSLAEAARLCLRLLAILHPSAKELPCFGPIRARVPPAEALKIVEHCQLFAENEPSPMSGSGFIHGLDRVRATVSGGETAVN